MQGYEALRNAAAWLDLAGRGKLYATGEDRARLLHAMTTNQVQQLSPGEGCYAFFLNSQGRILGDVCLFCLKDRLLLDTEPERREFLYQHLDKYIIADDVTLEDATGRMATLGVEGPEAGRVLRAAGAPVPEKPYGHAGWGRAGVARASYTGGPGFRIFAPLEQRQEIIGQLEAAGAVPASAQAARVVRLEHGRPRYGEDFADSTLPQETQLAEALHFTKGCYLGQEIVERIRSRGHVNRLLAPLQIEGSVPPEPGAPLAAVGAPAGEITSAAYSPALGAVVALGYVRAAQAAPGKRLDVQGRAAVVREAGRQDRPAVG